MTPHINTCTGDCKSSSRHGLVLRHHTSMLEVVGSIPAQIRPHSNTLRQGMNPWLLPDCTESGSIGVQNVQHLKIRWRFNGVLSLGGNVRLVKSREWLPQPVQDYKPIPLPLPLVRLSVTASPAKIVGSKMIKIPNFLGPICPTTIWKNYFACFGAESFFFWALYLFLKLQCGQDGVSNYQLYVS